MSNKGYALLWKDVHGRDIAEWPLSITLDVCALLLDEALSGLPLSNIKVTRKRKVYYVYSKRLEKVLRLRYGLIGGTGKTNFSKIGKLLNITPTRVQQINQKGLRMLRHPLRYDAVKAFIKEQSLSQLRFDSSEILRKDMLIKNEITI